MTERRRHNRRRLGHVSLAGAALFAGLLVALQGSALSFFSPARRLPVRGGGRLEVPHRRATGDAPVLGARALHRRKGWAKTPLSMSLDAAASAELNARMAAFTEGFVDGALDWEPSEALVRLLDAEQLSQLQQLVTVDYGGAPNVVVARLIEALSDAAAAGAAAAKGLALDSADDLFGTVERALAAPLGAAHGALLALGMTEEQTNIAIAAAGLLGASAVVKAALSVADFGSGAGVSEEADLPTTYDLEALHAFYSKRPVLVARRFLEVSSALSWFAIELLTDIAMGRWDENQPLRGRQLRELTSKNGPAFIKVGQGASIRPDILPPSWIKELEKLQDKVEPFGAKEARATMEKSLGCRLEDVFIDTSVFSKPVAAASLGQVYRARLRGSNEEVAVKVQRPHVLFTVTRDLYVMRIILNLLSNCGRIGPVRLGDTAKAFRSCIDSWAVRFMDELDYLTEAANAERFSAEMAKSEALGQAIIVPRVYNGLTTRYVLTTEWVNGDKLSTIDAHTTEGRARLATLQATLLNSYLTQLLESGFLHADPHPGNFLVTAEGKLVILDYGLMTEVTEEQRFALVEYVIHLTSKDYDATLGDLITLQFIDPRIGADPDKAAVIVPLLAKVMEQLSAGGGAQSITIEAVGEEVEELARNYPIGIPAYFGLIIRAFGAIEGLGLSLDPGYSIVNECFPYLARRLLTDDTPRMRRMLHAFLYGADGKALQVDQVRELMEGYMAFTALAAEASRGNLAATQAQGAAAGAQSGMCPPPAAAWAALASNKPLQGLLSVARGRASGQAGYDPLEDPVAVDAIKLLFNKEGNYVQDLVVDELARMTDALGRELNLEAVRTLRRMGQAAMGPIPVPNLNSAMVPEGLNPLLLPVQVPYLVLDGMVGRVEAALELNEDDQQSLQALRRIIAILASAGRKHEGGYQNQYALDPSLRAAGAAGMQGMMATDAAAARKPNMLAMLAGTGTSSLEVDAALDNIGPAAVSSAVLSSARRMAPVLPLITPGLHVVGEKFVRRLASRALLRMASSLAPPSEWEQVDEEAQS